MREPPREPPKRRRSPRWRKSRRRPRPSRLQSHRHPLPEQPAPAAPVAATATPETEIVDAKALRDQSLRLLEKAKNAEAMIAATKSLDADPTDAMPYLVLGSALQDAGHWNEAAHAYKLCLKNAKKGMVEECRAMVRRR
jgi:hypothetical protein